MASPPRSELVLRENGLWAILVRTGNTVNVVETGHLDRILAEQDLACWRQFGRLSTSGQAWIQAAARLAGNGSRRNTRHGVTSPVARVDILRLLLDQHYLCPITGRVLEPVFDGPWQPSVDRLDNARGYEPGNLRIVTLIANLAMNVWGETPLLRMADLIVTRGLRPDGAGWTKLRLLPAEPNALIQEEETPS